MNAEARKTAPIELQDVHGFQILTVIAAGLRRAFGQLSARLGLQHRFANEILEMLHGSSCSGNEDTIVLENDSAPYDRLHFLRLGSKKKQKIPRLRTNGSTLVWEWVRVHRSDADGQGWGEPKKDDHD